MPFPRARAVEAHGTQSIGDGEWNDGLASRRQLGRIAFAGIAGAHNSVLFSQRTRIVPSLSNESQRKPPPGQRMTAVPLASEAAGRKTVSVGRATLLMRRVESGGWRVSLSR